MMEHAVPQNVTTFEFHLVGDMTLRQFAFLASGAVLAYLTFAIFFSINPYIASPFIFMFAASGAALAFLPFDGRPLDHWLVSYFKAITSPTQGSWVELKLTNINKEFVYQNRLQLYLSTLGNSVSTQPNVPAVPPATPLSTKPLETKQPQQNPQPRPAPLPTKDELNNLVNMAKFAQQLHGKIQQTEEEIEHLKNTPVTDKTDKNYQSEYKEISSNLQDLVAKTEDLYKKTSEIKKDEPATARPAHVVVVKTEAPKQTQLTLTSSPNVINGVVTDVASNYLEGVIVIIHDKDNIPVRAIKTNKLGQFAGATPLPSGVYKVTLEKESLFFDALQITLDGNVLAPLRISAKKGGLQ